MNILNDLKWRYATKKFDSSKKISQENIDSILEAFNLTASSYGLQPVKLLVLQDQLKQNELVNYSMMQQQVKDASHVLVFCIDTEINEEKITEYFNLVKETRNTPDNILNPFKKFLIADFKLKSKDEIEAWAKNQAYLAMGNLLTVCAMLKIDSCPMEGFNPEKFDEILGLDKLNLKSVLVMPIGYRSEDDFMATLKKVRKPIEDMIIIK
ncbi:MAG TPA: NAD(P)H-dependent oxidoreductase [Flavobacteriaceae bacterium]|nr:NAD(P)H-dependent oxidoreductase [Flavobacteriaceae bacterium]